MSHLPDNVRSILTAPSLAGRVTRLRFDVECFGADEAHEFSLRLMQHGVPVSCEANRVTLFYDPSDQVEARWPVSASLLAAVDGYGDAVAAVGHVQELRSGTF